MDTRSSRSSYKLPPGWVEATDPQTGRIYYANPSTRETRWDPPEMMAAPSSHPPQSSMNSWSQSRYPSREENSYQRSNGRGSRSDHPESLGWNGTESGMERSFDSLPYNNGSERHSVAVREAYHPNQFHHAVPAAQAMLDRMENSFSDETGRMGSTDLELSSLSVGQIADLYHVQQHAIKERGDHHHANSFYVPFDLHRMSRYSNQLEVPEEGRIDVRLFALKVKLEPYQVKAEGSAPDK